ncbi:MAG: A/G-specific adenine glycosylase [Verrucomicrobiota bacterium]
MDRPKPRFKASPFAAKKKFREALGDWFARVGKDYPWRRTREPYPVLVSEMMLQQTQIATVLGKGYYTRFLEKFPDIESLARADDESLLKAWEGLGYYRRARMLRETARAILTKHAGKFPQDEVELLDLPGIGPYTAAALMAFAFGKPSGLVDGNVSRIFSRLMADPSPIDEHAVIRRHREWALELCDPTSPGIHHHAIMELGQTICRPGRPACEMCPVSSYCECLEPEKLPNKKPAAAITGIDEYAIFCRDSAGRILLHHESGKRRNGLWKLPLRSSEECLGLKKIYEATYAITRYRVSLKVFLPNRKRGSSPLIGDEWIGQDRLAQLPLAAPFRKALDAIIGDF